MGPGLRSIVISRVEEMRVRACSQANLEAAESASI